MPIYEYMCKKCAKPFEHLALNKSEAALCPHCGSKSVNRLMSASSIVVKSPFVACVPGECASEECGPGGGCGMGGCGMGGMCGF